jgi:50S ribosomal protein L16 3-hydroxylase
MLQNFDSTDFFNHYWQKKPLLIKGAIPHFQSPLERDELASLALEEFAQSRLVLTGDKIEKKEDYLVEHGPFLPDRFESLGTKNWNLLIQEVDHWSEEILHLRNYFSFIPHWRFDDVMASLGVSGGQVGAHLDWYDVFILQAEGTKQWLLEERPRSFEKFEGKHIIEDLEVKLLSDFSPKLEFNLEPGDVLYIPIGFAHQGINNSTCLSYSFGLRAPTLRDMIVEHLKSELEVIHEDERLKDDPSTWQRPGQIPENLVVSLLKTWPKSLTLPTNPQLWFGKLVTTPMRHELSAVAEHSDEELMTFLHNGDFFRNPHARVAYYLGEKSISLFANGERLSLERNPTMTKLMEVICDQLNFDGQDLLPFVKMDGLKLLLRFLYEQQTLLIEE